MKNKKVFTSIVAALSAITCVVSLSAGAVGTHSVRYNKKTSFVDQSGANVNVCTYGTKVALLCYYYAQVSMDSTTYNNANPFCTIEGYEKSSNSWVELAWGSGSAENDDVKMTNSWQYDPLYSTIKYSTYSLTSTLYLTK